MKNFKIVRNVMINGQMTTHETGKQITAPTYPSAVAWAKKNLPNLKQSIKRKQWYAAEEV